MCNWLRCLLPLRHFFSTPVTAPSLSQYRRKGVEVRLRATKQDSLSCLPNPRTIVQGPDGLNIRLRPVRAWPPAFHQDVHLKLRRVDSRRAYKTGRCH